MKSEISKAATRLKFLQVLPSTIKQSLSEPIYRPNLRLKNKTDSDEIGVSFDIQRKLKFLWSTPGFTVNTICAFYPLSFETLTAYKEHLNWADIALNEQIRWTEPMVIQLAEYLPTGLNEEETDQNCIECSGNSYFPWTEQVVEIFKERLNWSLLAQNKHFLTNPLLHHIYGHFGASNEQASNSDHISPDKIKDALNLHLKFPAIASNISPDTKFTIELLNSYKAGLQGNDLWLYYGKIWHDVFPEFHNDEAVEVLLSEILSNKTKVLR